MLDNIGKYLGFKSLEEKVEQVLLLEKSIKDNKGEAKEFNEIYFPQIKKLENQIHVMDNFCEDVTKSEQELSEGLILKERISDKLSKAKNEYYSKIGELRKSNQDLDHKLGRLMAKDAVIGAVRQFKWNKSREDSFRVISERFELGDLSVELFSKALLSYRISSSEEEEIGDPIGEDFKIIKKAFGGNEISLDTFLKAKKSAQEKKVGKVMSEYKAGTLTSGSGAKITDKDQAIAVALSEAGLSKSGISSNMTIEDIAKKHKIDLKDIQKEYKQGKAVEMEHTSDKEKSAKIARDHLFEDPKYYTKLAKIEKSESDEEETGKKTLSDSDKKKISDFIKNYEGEIKDEDLHAFVEKLKIHPSAAENYIYSLAKEHLNMGKKKDQVEDIVEKAEVDKYKAGCLMILTPQKDWSKILNIVKDKDLYVEENGFGKEDESHATVLYGFDLDKVTPNNIREKIKDSKEIKLKLKDVSSFSNDKYDVLKFGIESKDLVGLNKKVSSLPYSSDYPDYNPHMTIAYLKKGKAKDYLDKFKDYVGREINSSEFKYSYNDENGKANQIIDTKKEVEKSIEDDFIIDHDKDLAIEIIEKAIKDGLIDEDILIKAKYIKRTGSKGSYKYIYAEGSGSRGAKEEEIENIKSKNIEGINVKYTEEDDKFIIHSLDGNKDYDSEDQEKAIKELSNERDEKTRESLMEYYFGSKTGVSGAQFASANKYLNFGEIQLRIGDHSGNPKNKGEFDLSIVTHEFDPTENKFGHGENVNVGGKNLKESKATINSKLEGKLNRYVKSADIENSDELENFLETVEKVSDIIELPQDKVDSLIEGKLKSKEIEGSKDKIDELLDEYDHLYTKDYSDLIAYKKEELVEEANKKEEDKSIDKITETKKIKSRLLSEGLKNKEELELAKKAWPTIKVGIGESLPKGTILSVISSAIFRDKFSKSLSVELDIIQKAIENGTLDPDILIKAKYIKRTGSPGNYKYIYEEADEKGKKQEIETPVGEEGKKISKKEIQDKINGNRKLSRLNLDIDSFDDYGNYILYHGTNKKNAENISKEGLVPPSASPIYFMLTTNKSVAKRFAAGMSGDTVLKIKIPIDELPKAVWKGGETGVYQKDTTDTQHAIYGDKLPKKYISYEKNNSKIEKSFQLIEEAFMSDIISEEIFLKAENGFLEKGRTGTYGDNATNRRLKRVGKPYGQKAQEEAPKDQKTGKKEEPKGNGGGSLDDQAKNASGSSLEQASKEAKDPEVRSAAHKEIDRREKEEKVQEEEQKPEGEKETPVTGEDKKEPETKEESKADKKDESKDLKEKVQSLEKQVKELTEKLNDKKE